MSEKKEKKQKKPKKNQKKPDSTPPKTSPKSEVEPTPKGDNSGEQEMQDPEGGSAPPLERGSPGSKKVPIPAGISPELLGMLDERITNVTKVQIEAALEAFKPEVANAVKEAITQVVQQAQAANPGLSIGAIPPVKEGGAIPGSPVTSEGVELLRFIMQGNQPSDMDAFIQQASRYKAIGDLFHPPPTLMDRVMNRAVIKNLANLGLVSDKAMKTVDKELLGDIA